MVAPLEPELEGLIDDAAIFPPGNAPFDEALTAFEARASHPAAELVGSFVLRDTDLPQLGDTLVPVSIVCTGGAGQLAGPTEWVRRTNPAIVGMEIAVRDLDDPAGNVRRIVAATDELETEWPIFVELPHVGSTRAWLEAADEVAAAGLRLKFRTGGLEPEAHPASHALARWIDAALDRETQFKCTAGLHHAARHTSPEGFEQHGFLNVLVATARAFEGASTDEVVATLEERDGASLAAAEWRDGRRWFVSFGSCSVDEPLADLRDLGLVT